MGHIDFSRPPDTEHARAQTAAAEVFNSELMARLGGSKNSPAALVTRPPGDAGPQRDEGGSGGCTAKHAPAGAGAIERRPLPPGFSRYSIARDGSVYGAKGLIGTKGASVQLRGDDGTYTSRTIARLIAEVWGE